MIRKFNKFNESFNEDLNILNENEIKDLFAYSFDLCENYNIKKIYCDPIMKNVYTTFKGTEIFHKNLKDGFKITIEYKNYKYTYPYTQKEIDNFNNYVGLIKELNDEIDRFRKAYSKYLIFFESSEEYSEEANELINLIITPK